MVPPTTDGIMGNYTIAGDLYTPVGTSLANVSSLQGQGRPIFVEERVGMVIVRWIFPCVVLLGTMGNVLSLVVLLRKRMRTTSVNVYLAILACADTGVLYSNAFRIWIGAVAKFQMQHSSDAACKLVTYFFLVSIHMSAWLVVAISADRFIAVWFPFKSLTWSSVQRARIVSLVGFIILSIVNSHVFWTMHLLQGIRNRSFCQPRKGDLFMQNAYPWFKLATYSCVPFVLVLILNSCIIFKIWQGLRSQKSSFSDSQSTATSKAEGKITTMLVAVSLCWLILTAPFTLWSLTVTKTKDPRQNSRDVLAKIMCFLLMYINHACNFYIYCLTGRNFRKEFWDWLLCRTRAARSGVSSLRTFKSSVATRSVFPEPEESLLKYDAKRSTKMETSPV